MKRVTVYDMDGCIVCSLHRYQTIEGKIDLEHWRKNEPLCYLDSLLPLAEQYKKDLSDSDCFVIIATARELKNPDFNFIRNVLGQPNHIIGRKIGDSRSGGLLKVLGLKKLFSLKQFRGIKDITMYEDNISYLKTICDYFKCKGVYIPSMQGH